MGGGNSHEAYNPNFDYQTYMKKLDTIKSRYTVHRQFDQFQSFNFPSRKTTKTQKTNEIERTIFLFKPTLSIVMNQAQNKRGPYERVQIEFIYGCKSGGQLEINLGATNILEDEKTKKTTHIQSRKTFILDLKAGQKEKFAREFSVSQNLPTTDEGIIIRLLSGVEVSEYSLSFVAKELKWKPMVQKYEDEKQIYMIEDIYGNQQSSLDCIVCMSQTANTIIKPCNHLCLCLSCSKQLKNKSNNCPICRKKIAGFVFLQK